MRTTEALLSERLYKEFDHLAWYYRVQLRRPVISLGDFGSKLGEWDASLRQIRLSLRLLMNHPWDIVVEILKHEIAHQYVSEVFQVYDQHGEYFKRACDKLGVATWARRASVDIGDAVERNSSEGAGDDQMDRLSRRLERLLNLATSANQHEALSAMQRVREIYGRYNFEFADQARSTQDDYDYAVIYLGRKRIEQYQSMICSILNRFFFVKIIHTHYFDTKSGQEYKSIELIGNRPSLRMAEHVYQFLDERLPKLFKNFVENNGNHVHLKISRRSFYMGLLQGFYEKLANQKWGQHLDVAADGTSIHASVPVKVGALMVATDPQLECAFKLRFRRTRNSGWSSAVGDGESYAAGKVAGKDLVLNRPIENRGSQILQLK